MSEIALPKIDRSIVSNKSQIVKKLSSLTNPENVLSEADELRPYETDALSVYTQTPLAVVLPENTKEVSEILKYCNCLLYTSPSPRDGLLSRMPSSA